MAGRTILITLEEIDGVEYSMDDGVTWQDSPLRPVPKYILQLCGKNQGNRKRYIGSQCCPKITTGASNEALKPGAMRTIR